MNERIRPWQQLESLVVVSDRVDRRRFRTIFEQTPELVDMVNRGIDKVPEFASLLQDLFCSLYKDVFSLRPVETLSPAVLVNHAVLERMTLAPAWGRLRLETRLDAGAAVAGTLTLARALLAEMKLDAGLSQAQAVAQQAAQAQAEASRYEQAGATAQAEAAWERAQAMGAQSRQMAQGITVSARRLADRLVSHAQGVLHTATTRATAWGMDRTTRADTAIAEQLGLFRRLYKDKNIQQLTGLVEAYRGMADRSVQLRPDSGATVEISGLTTGRELDRVMPLEWALAGTELGQVDFARRLAEGQLRQYQLDAPEAPAPAPLIVMLDTSRSTDVPVSPHYRRRDWIGAVGVGLVHRAQAENRPVVVIHYGGQKQPYKAERHRPVVTKIAPAEKNPAKLLTIAEQWLDSFTTDLHDPLDVAVGELGVLGQAGQIVVVCDGGVTSWSQTWLNGFAQHQQVMGFTVDAFVVGEDDASNLQQITSRIHRVTADEHGMAVILEQTQSSA